MDEQGVVQENVDIPVPEGTVPSDQAATSLQVLEYEKKKKDLNFKINFYIQEIQEVNLELGQKLSDRNEEAINELISTQDNTGENTSIERLKKKLAECLKELGYMTNLRESTQINKIDTYINTLKEANAIVDINKFLGDGEKIPDIDLGDKKCEENDTTDQCRKKLEEALKLFDDFKTKMGDAMKGQEEKEKTFNKLKDEIEKFKIAFNGWMTQIESKKVEELKVLIADINKYEVSDELLVDNKDLMQNIVGEINILIAEMNKNDKFKQELMEAKGKKEAATVKMKALQDEELDNEVAAVAAETSETQVVPVNPSGNPVVAGKGESENQSGNPVVAALGEGTDSTVVEGTDESVNSSGEVVEGNQPVVTENPSIVTPGNQDGVPTNTETQPGTDTPVVAALEEGKGDSLVQRQIKIIDDRTQKQEMDKPGSSTVAPKKQPIKSGNSALQDQGGLQSINPKSAKETLELVGGGRKKKSRRRKKSKRKKKSKKNRR